MIPNRLVAQTSEKAIHGMASMFLPQIHLMLQFDGRLDQDRLSRALRLSFDAEPVLGCRFVPRWIRPYWERLPDQGLDPQGFLLENRKPSALDRFLGEDLDPVEGPQLKALLTDGPRGDCLVLKASHHAVDAGGTKEIGYLLARLYAKLATNPGYRPRTNRGSRSLSQVYRRFMPFGFFKIMRRYLRDFRNQLIPYQSLKYPSGLEKTGRPVFVYRRFDMRGVKSRTNATVNDLMVAAMLRALAKQVGWNGQETLRLSGTADLRRYLPDGRAASLCNLSSFYFCNFGNRLGDNLDETVELVKRQLDPMKNDYIGLGFILGTWLVALPYPYGLMNAVLPRIFAGLSDSPNMPPALTNMGSIDDGALDFGQPGVVSAELLTPPNVPPIMVSGISGFKDTITLSSSVYESAIPRAKVEELFDLVYAELTRRGLSKQANFDRPVPKR